MTRRGDAVDRLMRRLESTWADFTSAFAELPHAQLVQPGIGGGDWSVKDVLAHVTTWEEETLKHLPTILAGGMPPRYITLGGIDAFNARLTAEKRRLSMGQVRRQLDQTHKRLLDYLRTVPPEQLEASTRFRRRLRVDTYGHYPEHTAAIRRWRMDRD